MQLKITVRDFTKPFAIMKVGLKRYEGEADLWNLPKGCKPTFCHIIVRIDEELKRAKASGALSYPFLLNTSTVSVLESFDKSYGSIDIFFIPIKDEIDDWDYGFPDPAMINWDYDNELSRTIRIDGEESQIPNSIRLGDSEYEYPVLLIDDFEYYERRDSLTLDCIGAPCRNFSTWTPIERSLSSWVSFGVFENKGRTRKCKSLMMDIVAKAKLVPPYLGHVK